MSRLFLSGILVVCLLLVPAPSRGHLAIITQGPAAGGDPPEVDDGMGWSVAVGDFDGDGFEDLAAGSPGDGQEIVPSFEGALTVNYGGPLGLTHEGSQYITIGDIPDDVARFGSALAVGDFDDDGFDDLAVAVPQLDTPGSSDVGAVHVYRGSAAGLVPSAPDVFTPASVGLTVTAFGQWASALAAGDFNGDDRDDLAVGGPLYGAGVVSVLFGSAAGLTATGAVNLLPASVGSTESSGHDFGRALATGHVRGDLKDDLLIGAPGEAVQGIAEVGRLYVVPGSAGGLDLTDVMSYDVTDFGVTPSFGVSQGFGSALATGYLDGDGRERASIVVGEPRRDEYRGSQLYTDSGRVWVLDLPDGAVTPISSTLNRYGLESEMEPGDRFGTAVAVGDFDQDGNDDIAMSAPGVDRMDGTTLLTRGIGKVYLVYSKGGFGLNNEIWDPIDLNDQHYEEDTQIGAALAFGRFDASGNANLAIGAPYKDYEIWVDDQGLDQNAAGQVYVVAPWRQVQGLKARSAVAVNCEDQVVFSVHPFQRVGLASVTKTMTGLLACEAIEAGLDPNTTHVAPDWMDEIGCNCWPVKTGQQTGLLDLLRITMGKSANDASYAVADVMTGPLTWDGTHSGTAADFVDLMNARAQQLGMNRTLYTNPAGKDRAISTHHTFGTQPYSTAWDQAILARAAMDNECLAEIVGADGWIVPVIYPVNIYIPRAQVNTFTTDFGDFHSDAVGIKGGWTAKAEYTAMYAVESSSPAGGVVVGCGFGFGSWTQRNLAGAKLMNLATGLCATPASIPLPPPPDPNRPSGVFPDISVCWEEVREVGVTVTDVAYDPIVLEMRTWRSEGVSYDFFTSRTLVAELPWGETLTVGLDRFKNSGGWRVTNVGDTETQVRIQVDRPFVDQTVALQPGESYQTPATVAASFEDDLTFSVENLFEPATAVLQVEMLDHRLYSLNLGGIYDVELVEYSRNGGAIGSDEIIVRTFGLTFGCDGPEDNAIVLSFLESQLSPVGIPVGDPRDGPARLLATRPNPFRPSTTIHYELMQPSPVRLTVYDVRGRRVRSLVDGTVKAGGLHRQVWDGRGDGGAILPAGVYLVRLEAAGVLETRQVVRLK